MKEVRPYPALRRGTHGKAGDVRAFRTQEIRITTRKPRPVNTDGELTTHTPAHFKVMPKILRIYAPPAGQRGGTLELAELGNRLLGALPSRT